MEPPVEDEKYDFADIFPTCKYYFDSVTKKMEGDYSTDCFSISKEIHNDVNPEFLQPCQKLIQYLKYIKKESSTGNHIQSCKYFSYILKNELRSFNNTCNGTKECYNKIHKTYEETSHGIDVCKDHIEEINETIFKKFQNLDSLYDIFYKFTSTQGEEDNGKCALGKTCSEQYYTLINICDQNSNIGFCMALDKFRDSYNFHMKNESECDKVPRYLYSPFGTERRRTFSISLITMFAMSITMFTVYKFTPVHSWLHSILRRKSNIRNDLYEESRDLKNNDNIKKLNSRNSPLNIQYYSSENS